MKIWTLVLWKMVSSLPHLTLLYSFRLAFISAASPVIYVIFVLLLASFNSCSFPETEKKNIDSF